MSKYINDPREMAIQPKIGVTYEEDNRKETMYHWGAKVLDLCNLPVDEYMKPMTVNVNGSINPESGTTPTKRNVLIKVDIVNPSGDVISANGEVIDHIDGNGNWVIRWTWDKDYNGVVASKVKTIDDNNNEYITESFISDNADNEYTSVIGVNENNSVVGISDYGIGINMINATGTSVTISDIASNVEYNMKIEPNSKQAVIDYDLFYGIKSISESLSANELTKISLYDADSENGVTFGITIPISQEYTDEYALFDEGESPYDGDNAQELMDAWIEEYERIHIHTLRMYIPTEIESQYTYQLFIDNAGEWLNASLNKNGNIKTYNGKEYYEYVNEDDSYVYDDVEHRFNFKFIVNKK